MLHLLQQIKDNLFGNLPEGVSQVLYIVIMVLQARCCKLRSGGKDLGVNAKVTICGANLVGGGASVTQVI